MGRKFVISLFSLFAFTLISVAANKKFTLVIDPGHGGKDAGALGAFSKEKDINLNVALAFGRNVERNCPDVKVIYTRTTDIFIPLKERANIANKNKADLFISVHTNALPGGKQAYGMETYTLGMHRAGDNFDVAKRENSVILIEKDYRQSYQGFNPNSSESYIMFEFIQDKNMENSVDLARMIQRETCSVANRPDKGVHQAGFLVLRETSMPSCLVELGFITTPEEENLLNDKDRIGLIAKGIYRAFVGYKSKYDNTIVVPYKAPQNTGTKVQDIVPDSYKQEETANQSGTTAPPKQDITREAAAQAKRTGAHTSQLSEQPKTTVAQPMVNTEQLAVSTVNKSAVSTDSTLSTPIFKVQIIAASKTIQEGSNRLKGLKGIDSFTEGGMIKYTYGASADYNEIFNLRKQIKAQFPDAFIIAFKNGVRMDVNKAINEFKANSLRK